jgi:hypothetical protein
VETFWALWNSVLERFRGRNVSKAGILFVLISFFFENAQGVKKSFSVKTQNAQDPKTLRGAALPQNVPT